MRLPGINSELAAAVRRIGSLRSSLPKAHRPEFDLPRWRKLERELDRHCSAGSVDCALTSIERWERETAEGLSQRLLNAPLGRE